MQPNESAAEYNRRLMELDQTVPDGWLIFDSQEFRPGLSKLWRVLNEAGAIDWELSIHQNRGMPEVYENALFVGQMTKSN